jgi:Uma2 family endonuclease
VVDLASPSDDGPRGITALRHKMASYRVNGAALGWLLLPEDRAVEIWTQTQDTPQRLNQAMRLEGGDVLPGLLLELGEIW